MVATCPTTCRTSSQRGQVVNWDGLESTLFYVLYDQVRPLSDA